LVTLRNRWQTGHRDSNAKCRGSKRRASYSLFFVARRHYRHRVNLQSTRRTIGLIDRSSSPDTLRHQLIVLTLLCNRRCSGHFLHYRKISSTSTVCPFHNFARPSPHSVGVLENIESNELELLRVPVQRGRDTSSDYLGARSQSNSCRFRQSSIITEAPGKKQPCNDSLELDIKCFNPATRFT
jgi:hypothetical protein